MTSKLKKALQVCGIFFGIIVGIVLIKCCVTFIPAFIAVSSESRAKLEYYDHNMPDNEIELPYHIRDYEAVYLTDWSFETLTAKVKENKRDTDFWVFQDNYDILFGSDDYFYIRKDVPFSPEVSENTAAKITFSTDPTEDYAFLEFSPNFTEEEVACFTKLFLSDEVFEKQIQDDQYFSFENDVRISWYIFFNLKSTDEICYDGLRVQYDTRYWLVRDTEGDLYLKDFNNHYKLLPKDIAEKIEQSWQQQAGFNTLL